MHKPIAIVAAMRREIAPLLQGATRRKQDGIDLYELPSALVAIGGIGQKAALKAAEAAIRIAGPEVIVSAGFAGALSNSLRAGDVLYGREVLDEATAERYAAAQGDAVIVTALRVAGAERKRDFAARYSASAVDMEGAAVAMIARQRGLRFMAVKAISDELDSPVPPVDAFVDAEGKLRTLSLAAFIAVRPNWWVPAIRLGRNSSLASQNLCKALKHLINQQTQTLTEENSVRA